MKDKWDRLITLLFEIVALYKAILELSRQKSQVLIAAKTKELDELNQKEELLIVQVGKLDAARRTLMQEMAEALGLNAEGITFSQMVAIAEPDDAKQLEEVAESFSNIMKELAPVNLLNTELIQQALRYVNYNINLLTQSTVAPTYAPQGQNGQAGTTRRLVDRKI